MTTDVGTARTTGTTADRPVALIAGVAAIALAVKLVVQGGAPAADYESLGGWAHEVLFLTFLLSSIWTLEALRRRGLVSSRGSRAAQAGYSLIALGVVVGMALRDDPDWFFLLAGPGLLLSSVGFVAMAVIAYRRRTLAPAAAALLGIGGLVAIIAAELGTGVLLGSFWLYAGVHLLSRAPSRHAAST